MDHPISQFEKESEDAVRSFLLKDILQYDPNFVPLLLPKYILLHWSNSIDSVSNKLDWFCATLYCCSLGWLCVSCVDVLPHGAPLDPLQAASAPPWCVVVLEVLGSLFLVGLRPLGRPSGAAPFPAGSARLLGIRSLGCPEGPSSRMSP